MTLDVHTDAVSKRIAALYAEDDEFRAAEPSPAVLAAARRPGLRLAQVLKTLMEGYADRPALGTRATAVARSGDRSCRTAATAGLRHHHLRPAVVGRHRDRGRLE